MTLLLLLRRRVRLTLPQCVLVRHDEIELGFQSLVRCHQLPALQRHHGPVGKRRMLRIPEEEVRLIASAELGPNTPLTPDTSDPMRRRKRV